MIKTLVIKDFQAHKQTSIELDPHVTTIVGPSDAGKSAIIRALRWVCLNRPSGDEFIRVGSEETSVRIVVDGNRIRRRRGKNENSYTINDKKLVSFKDAVPAEVAQATNVGEINFQGQHDSPFWFSKTAGEVSRELNEIINLGLIDKVLGSLNSRLRDSKATVTVVKDRLAQAELELAKLKGILDTDDALDIVETAAATAAKKAQDRDELDAASKEGLGCREKAERAKTASVAGALVLRLGEVWDGHWRAHTGLRDQLAEAIEKKNLAGKVVPAIGTLEQKQNTAHLLRHDVEELEEWIDLANEYRNTHTQYEGQATKCQAEIGRIKTCETCGQLIAS